MNKKKIIIGLIGETNICQKTADILHSFGFYKVPISDKVREIAKYLLKLNDDEITPNVINQIRNRGYCNDAVLVHSANTRCIDEQGP